MPAIIGMLDSKNLGLAEAAASALGSIGDFRALPSLLIPASVPGVDPSVQSAARAAVAKLSGRPFGSQVKTPLETLTNEAWSYHRGERTFPGEQVELWSWKEGRGLESEVAPAAKAQESLGLKFARAALELSPKDRSAQIVYVSLLLEQSLASGRETPPAEALSASPSVLADVLSAAIADQKSQFGAAAASLLGKATDVTALEQEGKDSPLVKALWAPDRKIQFAAARQIVLLNPKNAFPGSSLIVPVLTRFIAGQKSAKAVVIDSSINRANTLSYPLRKLGFDTVVAETGPRGFTEAAKSADVEIIFVEPSLIDQTWRVADLLSNLRGDARTGACPWFSTAQPTSS